MAVVFIGVGSNLGDRKKNLRLAIAKLSEIGRNLLCSHVYRTNPYGFIEQPKFLNMVIRMETDLFPEVLLSQLLHIETIMGRIRTQKWGPRVIDLDILFYDTLILKTPHLTLPHPDLHNREFVLRPLIDIDPYFIHPGFGKCIKELWENLKREGYPKQEKEF